MKKALIQVAKKLNIEESLRNLYYKTFGRLIPKHVLIHGVATKCYVLSAHSADAVHILPDEAEVQNWLVQQLNRDDVVWDIGANVGQWAIYCARAVSQGGHVFCFEPEPTLCRMLRKTLAANGLLHAEVLQLALGDHDGDAQLYVGVNDSSISSIAPRADQLPVQTFGIRIDMATGAGVVRKGLAKLPQAIKLDAEGAECAILKGFDEQIWSSCRLLIVEVHPLLLPALNSSLEEIRDLLTQHGFRIEKVRHRSTVQLWMCVKNS